MERHSERGTLLCTCGKEGVLFPYSHAETNGAGKTIGVLRGFCSDEHYSQWVRDGKPQEQEIKTEYVKPHVYKDVGLFG